MRESLDRHITGNYGENQFKGISQECQEENCKYCEGCECICHEKLNDLE